MRTNRSKPLGQATRHIAILSLLPLAIGCGGGQDPKTLPPQTVSQAGPELEPPPPLPPPTRPVATTPTETYKVIDAGEDPRPKTLVEASRLAKTQKAQSAPPVIEINDENLSEQAAGGQVTIMSTGPAAPPPPDDTLEGVSPLTNSAQNPGSGVQSGTTTAIGTGDTRDEVYWRRRGLSIRRNWRDALDTIDRLELEAASLRQQFYAHDDPYVRDNRIKPAWDRALDRIEDLREEATLHEEALGDFLEDGGLEGVPAAWLNDGWELEPDADELEALDARIPTQDAVNTPVLENAAEDIDTGGRS